MIISFNNNVVNFSEKYRKSQKIFYVVKRIKAGSSTRGSFSKGAGSDEVAD